MVDVDDEMPDGRTRPARRSRHRVVAVAVAALLLLGVGVVDIVTARGAEEPLLVTVRRGATTRVIELTAPATVGAALRMADVVPAAGRLRSLSTGQILDESYLPAVLTKDGSVVDGSALLTPGATIDVVESPDQVEAAADVEDAIAPAPPPDVIHALWRTGRPGRGVFSEGVRSRERILRSTVEQPVAAAPVVDKEIALTFDDGPWSTTPAVLAVLKEKGVHAMFCMVGYTLNPHGVELAKQVVADGHPICNHTVHHDEKIATRRQAVIDQEIVGNDELLTQRIGIPRPTYFRPPGGSLGPGVVSAARAEGQQVLMWTIDPADYKTPPAAEIVRRVIGGLRPGAVILLHDGGGDRAQTVAAVGPIIDQARALGYTFVTPDTVAPVGAAPASAPAPVAAPAAVPAP